MKETDLKLQILSTPESNIIHDRSTKIVKIIHKAHLNCVSEIIFKNIQHRPEENNQIYIWFDKLFQENVFKG